MTAEKQKLFSFAGLLANRKEKKKRAEHARKEEFTDIAISMLDPLPSSEKESVSWEKVFFIMLHAEAEAEAEIQKRTRHPELLGAWRDFHKILGIWRKRSAQKETGHLPDEDPLTDKMRNELKDVLWKHRELICFTLERLHEKYKEEKAYERGENFKKKAIRLLEIFLKEKSYLTQLHWRIRKRRIERSAKIVFFALSAPAMMIGIGGGRIPFDVSRRTPH